MIHQLGDGFVCCLFDVEDFDEVAAVVKARKRRRVSEENRQEARQRMLELNQRNPSPERSQRPETGAEPPTRLPGQFDESAA